MRKTYEEMEVADEFVMEETAEAEEVLVEEAEPETVSLIGVVSACELLNVRMRPEVADNNVVCIIKKDEMVVIDLEADTANGWYKVYTEAGVGGYCMAQFITIK